MTDSIAQRIRNWREERGILRFVDEQYGAKLDAWQEKALLLFASPKPEHRFISLQACVGPGKSAILAMGGGWFFGTQGEKGEHPKGAALSVTHQNLMDNLWSEYAKWFSRSPYLSQAFTVTQHRIFANDHPATWFLSARSFPKTAAPDEQGKTLSGLHGKYVLVQVDESGGIPKTVLRAGMQAFATNIAFGKFIQAGNPISLEGMLHAAANELRGQWVVVRITGDPDDPEAWVHSPRVGDEPRKWAQLQIDTYGRDNPWVKSYILGMFPDASINSLLGVDDVEASMARRLEPAVYEWSQKRLGCDVARFGDDRFVIFPRQGLRAFNPKAFRYKRGAAIATDFAAAIYAAKRKWGSEIEFMDATGGWGAGTRDVLLTSGVTIIDVNFGGPANDPAYENTRAEIWFRGAHAIKSGLWLPEVPELVAELTAPTYTFSKRGKFLLEPKELTKKLLGRSPDLADALMTTWKLEDMPADVGHVVGRALRAGEDVDPRPGYTSSRGGRLRRIQPEPFEPGGQALRAGDDDE